MMFGRIHQRSAITGIVCLLLLPGCSGKSDAPKVASVSGTVTKGGKPFEGAEITFNPVGKGRHAAVGVTDAAGKFELLTGSQKGAEPGDYKVTISRMVRPDGTPVIPIPGPEGEVDPANDPEMLAAQSPPTGTGDPAALPDKRKKKVKQELPPEYSNVEKTVLKFTVPAEGTANADFKLD